MMQPPDQPPINVLIIDDHRLFNDGLNLMLADDPVITVVGQIYHSREAIAQVLQRRPDVLIIDFNMPEIDGLDLTRQLTATLGPQRILVLSMYGESRYIDDFRKAGASGYMLKTSSKEELVTAIRSVAAGTLYFDPKLADEKQFSNHTDDIFLKKYRLSPREVEIIRHIKSGLSSPQIAEKIHLSQHTVDTHRKNIHAKLGISTVADLVRFAIEMGL
ncbi:MULTISPECIES: response regulator [Spirosoma]|uniref:Response regulator transcription factor n=1 Tax=Spirosoma liriopis TaxID=2937440 RepID=A0ABT0HMN9_9BACT|nr:MULTISPECIES: response regulator transcription factor [Spirosoma]MCK8493436.1 response regulator transcription factor [Spirosoma liriopis]UHG92817.1 response regulator transcription factor [Spirosoma oryzicola]